MVYETIATMLTNISLFGTSIVFVILALIAGFTRGMGKKSELWALTFSVLAWIMALMIPNAPWASIIFFCGAISVTIAYMPLLKKSGDANILVIGIIFIIMNLTLIIATNTWSESLSWDESITASRNVIATTLGTQVMYISSKTPNHGLCLPEDPDCSEEETKKRGIIDILVYEVWASLFNIGGYAGKAIGLASMAVLGPVVIQKKIAPQITNIFIGYLIGIYITMWNLIILYKIVIFILRKSGVKNG